MESRLAEDFWKEFYKLNWSWRFNRELLVRRELSQVCVKVGIVPKVCPLCLNPTEYFELHHWRIRYLETAFFQQGYYRRMCPSCNRVLVWCGFRKPWEEQWRFLCKYYTRNKKRRLEYPNFDGVERGWSRFLPIEEKLYRKVLEVWKLSRD